MLNRIKNKNFSPK